jgi:hypothetical protein
LQTDGVHEEDQAEFWMKARRTGPIEAEVGKEKAGKERSGDAQAEPPDLDAPQSQSRGCHQTENDDALGDRLGLWNIGQPVKQNSFPFTGEAVVGLLVFHRHLLEKR